MRNLFTRVSILFLCIGVSFSESFSLCPAIPFHSSSSLLSLPIPCPPLLSLLLQSRYPSILRRALPIHPTIHHPRLGYRVLAHFPAPLHPTPLSRLHSRLSVIVPQLPYPLNHCHSFLVHSSPLLPCSSCTTPFSQVRPLSSLTVPFLTPYFSFVTLHCILSTLSPLPESAKHHSPADASLSHIPFPLLLSHSTLFSPTPVLLHSIASYLRQCPAG